MALVYRLLLVHLLLLFVLCRGLEHGPQAALRRRHQVARLNSCVLAQVCTVFGTSICFMHKEKHLPIGPSVASSEKTASLNSFLRFSDRQRASLTANRSSSAASRQNNKGGANFTRYLVTHFHELCVFGSSCANAANL